MINILNILKCFPARIYQRIDNFLKNEQINMNDLEEIRIRTNRPIIIKLGQVENVIDYNATCEEVLEILRTYL